MFITKEKLALHVKITDGENYTNQIWLHKSGFELSLNSKDFGNGQSFNLSTALEAAEILRVAVNKAHKIWVKSGRKEMTLEMLKGESDLVIGAAKFKLPKNTFFN
jgi:hypothetical protein